MMTALAPVRQKPRAVPTAVPPVLSIVLPARNEAAGIQTSVTTVDTFLAGFGLSYEIIVGDSGSSDDTATRVLALGLPRVRVIRVGEPGKGLILSRALTKARGTVVGFIDSDLEIAVSYLAPAISAVLSGKDAAIASKVLNPAFAASRSTFRRLTTAVANRVIRFALGTCLTDHQAGLKVFRRDSLLPALTRVRSTGWLWDTELLATMSAAGASIAEIAVETSPSRPSGFGSVRQLVTAAFELSQICTRVRLARWFNPVRPGPAPRTDSLLPIG